MTKKQALLQMLMTIRQRGRLPAEYQEVEYLKSSGNQYINTGFKPTNNSKIEIKVKYTAREQFSFGSRTSSNGTDQFTMTCPTKERDIWSGFGSQLVNTKKDISINEEHIYKLSQAGSYVDNELITIFSAQSFSSNLDVYLFGLNQNGSLEQRRYEGYIYWCHIYENNVLVRNFIPCYRKSDNEIGLYDLVNDVFYTNAGTGTFLKGGNI